MTGFRLQILVDHAEERSKQAAVELKNLRLKWAQEEQKKIQLEGYLEDYQLRLNQIGTNGISVTVMMDFRRFISKIELAIKTQQEEIVRCQQRWEVAQIRWKECEREIKAYQVLKDRYEDVERMKEYRKEQQLQDEFAQAGHQRKLSGNTLT